MEQPPRCVTPEGAQYEFGEYEKTEEELLLLHKKTGLWPMASVQEEAPCHLRHRLSPASAAKYSR